MIRTNSLDQWEVQLGNFKFMKKEIKLVNRNNKTNVIFDPSTPFIEIPEREWNHIWRDINTRIKGELLLNCDINMKFQEICT